MNHSIIVAFIVILSCVTSLSAAELEVSPNNVEFGEVDPGIEATFLERTAVLKNTSNHPVTINRIDVGCGCLSAEWPRARTLVPGEGANVVVRLDRLKASRGPHSFSLRAYSGASIVAEWMALYTYIPPVDASPRTLSIFGPAGSDHDATADIMISERFVHSGGHLELAYDDPFLSGHIQETNDPAERMLHVVASAKHPVGRIDTRITITDDSGRRLLSLPIVGEIEAAQYPIPRVLLLGTLTAGMSIDREVALHSSVPFTLSAVKASKAFIAISPIGPSGMSTEHRFQVKVSVPSSFTGILDAEAIFYVSGTEDVQVHLPIVAELSR